MDPQLTTLLCLLFFLDRIQAQEELRIPTISAKPSPVVPLNGSVRILCQGTCKSFLYQLLVEKNDTYNVVQQKMGFKKEVEFNISNMNRNTGGNYRCRYRQKKNWSETSETLELAVTGFYDKPVLSTEQDLVMMPGENISFQCSSTHTRFDRFSLVKEGRAPQHQHGEHQVNFMLGPVNPDFTGKYRCYGWYNSNPYEWSAPSDALEFLVDSKNQDCKMKNLTWVVVAGLILLVLLVILVENWYSHRTSQENNRQDLAPLSLSIWECQV